MYLQQVPTNLEDTLRINLGSSILISLGLDIQMSVTSLAHKQSKYFIRETQRNQIGVVSLDCSLETCLPCLEKVLKRCASSIVVGVEDMNLEQQNKDVTTWSRSGLGGASVDACVIEQALATPMDEPDDDMLDEEEDPDDTYTADGVLPPFSTPGEDSDDDFFCVKFAQGTWKM